MSARLLALLAALAWALPGRTAAADGGDARAERLAAFELELAGPARGLEVLVPGAGRAELAGSFAAGESARFELLLPAPRSPAGGAPELRFEGAGRAALRALPERDAARRARFEALPRGLRARAPIAPPGADAPVPAPAALWLVAGLFALGWPLRRRSGASLGLGLLGAAAVFWLARAPVEAAVLTVAEAQGPQARLVLVEAARGRLALGGPGDLLRLESRPARAELLLRGTPGGADLAVEGPGAALFAFRDGERLSLSRGRNGVFDLEQVWLRESGAAAWAPLGPWPRGAPLPAGPDPAGAAAEPAADPPGWLIAALPQGPAILVGGGAGRWLRWVDPPPPGAASGAENPPRDH